MAMSRILIALNDFNISNMLRAYFQCNGYEVTVTSNGEDALEICRQQLPNLILLDVNLPDMDGFDVLLNLKALSGTRGIPVIFFLAKESSRLDKIRALELGAVECIRGPFDIRELGLRVKNKIGHAFLSSAKQPHAPGGEMMIVEDDPDISNMLRVYFKSQGYKVAVAGRGEDALAICRQQPLHMIVLDIMLTDMNGYDVCRELRGNLLTAHVPIVFLTQKDEQNDKIHGLEVGADDYITKPFDLEELKLRVQNTCRRADLDPLTGLPCSQLIEDQLAYLFFRPQDWALLYISIDGLDPFSALHGPGAREEVLCFTAMKLVQVVSKNAKTTDFVGRVCDDAFIIITDKGLAPPLAEDLNRRFDAKVGSHYDWQTRQRGHLLVRDDEGNETKVDLMSLSIGVATADDGPFADIREIIQAAAEARRTSRFSHPLHPNTEANSPCA